MKLLFSSKPASVDRMTAPNALERAFDLASAGACATVADLVIRLRMEGYHTARTELRSSILRRELRALCAARFRPK